MKRTIFYALAILLLGSLTMAQVSSTTSTFSGGAITTFLSVPDGTAAAPTFRFTSEMTGLYLGGAGELDFSIAGTKRASLTATTFSPVNSITMASAQPFQWSTDLLLYRDAAATLQLGADAATATGQTIKAADSTDAGVAGADLNLKGGTGGTLGAQGNVVANASGNFVARNFSISLTADSVAQVGNTVMPDAGTDDRFDVTTGSATLTIGVLAGNGPSVQGTLYPVVTSGITYVAQAEDQTVTRGHFLIQSATAGYCNDSAAVTTIGLNIAKALRSEPVTNTINPAGCTGGSGCINTALNTPNAGPAGQITLAADVAAAGWVAGEPVVYWNSGGASPTGLTDGKVYFLASVATTNVTISATKGGAVVVPSDQGNDATQYLARLPLAVVSIQ